MNIVSRPIRLARAADSVRTLTRLTVTDEPAEQALEIRMNSGCVLILEAVDAETGRGHS